jgi:hypothetical protein
MNWLFLSVAAIGIAALAWRRYTPWLEQILTPAAPASPRPPVIREATALDHMIEALRQEKDPLERHRLLGAIVDESHRQRSDVAMKKVFLRFARMHVTELPQMAAALQAAHGGKLPAVATFELLAAALEEDGRSEEAEAVRTQAGALGWVDRMPAKSARKTATPARKIKKALPAVRRTGRAGANTRRGRAKR